MLSALQLHLLNGLYLVVLVVVAVLTSTWATCVEGATATVTQQMACCKAGHDDCPMKDSASNCCRQSGPQSESQATIVRTATPHTPVLTILVDAILSGTCV